MIIETRYRDIPFEEASQCLTELYPNARELWLAVRGSKIQIEIPAEKPGSFGNCDGPGYRVLDENYFVCHHMAEIGD